MNKTKEDIQSNNSELQYNEINHPFDKYFRVKGNSEGVASIARGLREAYFYLNNLEKDGHNPNDDYDYISMDNMINEISKVIGNKVNKDNSFAVFTSIMNSKISTKNDYNYTDCIVEILVTFIHTETGAMIQTLGRGYGRDETGKHMFKAITNAFKYVVKYAFLISSGGVDPESNSIKDNGKENKTEKEVSTQKQDSKNKKQEDENKNFKEKKEKETERAKYLKKLKKEFKNGYSDLVIKESKKIFTEKEINTSDLKDGLSQLDIKGVKELFERVQKGIKNKELKNAN